jgi:hypothetical protein
MPTTITSAGITFNDATSLTSAVIPANAVGATQIANGSVTAAKLGTTEQKQIAKAWVNFNGTTSPGTIRSSYNVSSVTKNGTGDYTINFTSALADANYALFVTPQSNSTTANAVYTVSYNVNSARIVYVQTGVSNVDQTQAGIAVFGN